MTAPSEYEAWFFANQPLIDQLLLYVTRRLGLRGDDADEFQAEARAWLWEDDYAILRKWRRESSLKTYLTIVLLRFGHGFRRTRWGGRWHPSAAAQRLGPPASRLEMLVYRDGLRLDEAGLLLRTRGETTLSDRALHALLAQLPVRERPRRVDDGEVPIETIADGGATDDRVRGEETDAEWASVRRVLESALRHLSAEEQVVIRMHFLQGVSVADIARTLRVEQKPLYRMKDAALRALRRHLLDAGMTWDRLRDFLGGPLPERDDRDDDGPAASGARLDGPVKGVPPGKSGGPRPSNESYDLGPSDRASGWSDSARSGRSNT